MRDIAIFVSTIGSGGAEKQAALLAQVLSKHYNVHFVALYGENETSDYVMSILIKANVKVYPLAGSLREKFKEYSAILRDNHVFCAFNYLTKCDFWGSIIEMRCGVKLRYNGIRNSKLDGYKNVLEWISHNFIATGTIFNCYSGERAFIKIGFKKSKCITIPNCFPKIAGSIRREDNGNIHIITVGRFHPQKDYETAIKTIAMVKRFYPNVVFDICGYGALEEQIRGWVKQYGIEDITKFHIHPDNIPELLQQSDIYLSSSLYEGTSNSIMEAMNWSLPIVATNVGDNNMLVNEGINGFLSPVRDFSTLSRYIQNLVSNHNLRILFGERSNELLRDNFSINIFEERYLNVIGD